METQKIAKVRVSVNFLEDFLAGRWKALCKQSSAPDDLTVICVEQPRHAIGEWFYVICASSHFAPIPLTADPPEISPVVFEEWPPETAARIRGRGD